MKDYLPAKRSTLIQGCLVVLAILAAFHSLANLDLFTTAPPNASSIRAQCRALSQSTGSAPNLQKRVQSDRFVPGTKATLIKDATIWTGGQDGDEIIRGDILLDKGLIKGVGDLFQRAQTQYKDQLVVVDANGSFVTSGIIDIHSHLGDDSAPDLRGSSDTNSIKGPVVPWLRALDGLNTHDASYELSISGGVTTSLVLPGSANAIGGQGFVIKLRKTAERSSSSLLLEPPFTINSSFPDPDLPHKWRHMKHACGENPDRVYQNTRMDTAWAFREAYNKAKSIKNAQDLYCDNALAGRWADLGDYPQDLQWESMVEILRGRVKVHAHCYEAVDLDNLVRLSNEFQFPIAAFHHAHETYLVPDILKNAYGQTPAVALFATNSRYKREAYRGSEFAPRIHADNGIRVTMKSDHPVLNSRYLLYEAQQAHYYGLPRGLALASVTSTPASVMGMDHRIGYLKEGYDADLVIWDSHPLNLGAAPKQVFIDGIAQLQHPAVIAKPRNFQQPPNMPNFDQEAKDAVKFEGLPPISPTKASAESVLFINVKTVYTGDTPDIKNIFSAENEAYGVALVQNGVITCSGPYSSCEESFKGLYEIETIDLRGGAISPGLTTFGSPLGLEEIQGEPSTWDGIVYDPLTRSIPRILGGDGAIVRAVDGLSFASRDAYLAYRSGVTSAITAPLHYGFLGGLATAFSTGASHKLDKGAILQEVTGMHVSIGHLGTSPSTSTQIAALRRLLLEPLEGPSGEWFKSVTSGKTTLVVEAQSADVIATLIHLKWEVEKYHARSIKMTITGAAEAHILSAQLAEANVGVILRPSRPFPYTWEGRRVLPGPPMTQRSAVAELLAHNVTVAVGIEEVWSARNTRLDVAWAALESDRHLSEAQALALGSVNVRKLLGEEASVGSTIDLVATEGGGLLDFESKIKAVISAQRALVDLF